MARLLDVLPANTGMAFLLVQHLDPHHPSQLAELLSTHTAMPIVEATEGMGIGPDSIYICPPGRFLAVRFGVLHLTRPLNGDHARLPIDFLIRSLAEECGARSVAVILSGTGSDGSGGLDALHASGGHIIVQDPSEAEHDGMPRTAVQSGLAHAVMPLVRIPAELAIIGQRIAAATSAQTLQPDGYEMADIQTIITLLQQEVGQDFSAYKRGTLERRIHRRMGLRGLPAGALTRYHDELARNHAECLALAEDLLINVTSFFRDPEVFALLEREVIPELLENLAAGQALRIWVVGCSTGEEAYSLAIIMRDAIMTDRRDIKLQVFASDIDAQAIAVAREGLYSLSIKDEVPAERLARYFVQEEGGYRVSQALRGSVVFTVQDVLNDPPFSRMDMVSCRNLLIYLKPDAQAKVIGLFHFALRENGVLLLGMAETPGNVAGRFAVLHKPERIYRHIAQSMPGEPGFPLSFAQSIPRLTVNETKAQATRQTTLANLCRDTVLDNLAPASLLINAQRQCIFSVGAVSRYLRLPAGPPTLDLLVLAPEELRGTLRFAISRADHDHPLITTGLCEVSAGGAAVFFTITVRFLESDGEALHLVSFIEQAPPTGGGAAAPAQHDNGAQLRELERQLETAHVDLLSAIQSRDALSLEHKAINDEALSVNEEFQSTNEELLTSKEELQSLNEELIALNSQLQETLDRQRIASDDLQNILYSTNVATLFLDEKLRIRFFTPATKAFFGVIPGDIGRPLADLQSLADDDDLLADAGIVMLQSTTIEREISGPGSTWFVRRIFPYRTHDDRVEGVVITFIDITERRRTAAALEEARRAAEQSNRGKSRFLAVASHDLRQPLQSLSLIQEMLRLSVADPGAQEQIGRFGLLLGAMTGMLDSLLDIDQIESGVIEVSTAPFTLASLFKRLREEFAPLAEAQGLQLRVIPSTATVLSDARLFEAMLRNLFANAIKYTPPGGRILLGCRHRDAMLRIEVWDTGIGIRSDQLGPIFDEFYQVDNPAASRERGFGLGLTIVRELGLLLGHAVTVRSRPDKGSVFAVTLPYAPSGGHVARSAEPVAQSGPTTGCTIALVEDDPDVRDALEALLTEAGHTVISARDGPEALALAHAGAILPDLVLTDYNLPGGMNGVVVLANLRKVLKQPIPGIVLTGDISKDALAKIELADCLMLSKPVTAAKLHAAIRKVTPDAIADHGPATRHPTRLICVLEDNPDMRKAMLSVLGNENWQIITYPSAEAFLAAESATETDCADRCLIIDTNLPGMSGIALIEMLRARGDSMPAVLITGTGDIAMAVQAMRSGASDFIERPVSRRDLIDSIERAVSSATAGRGRDVAGDAIVQKLMTLTARQKDVLDMVMAGEPSKNIAADLGISQRTVESHRAQIMQKLGVRTIPDLVRAVLLTAPT